MAELARQAADIVQPDICLAGGILELKKIAAMAEALSDRLVEAEINPVFVMPEGQGVRAVDGLAVLA